MTAKTFSSWKSTPWESQWMKMIFISIGLHLLILGLFLNVFPKGGTAMKLDPAYIVDLVSLPGSGPVGTSPKTKEPTAAPAPASPPPRVVSKPIPIPKPVPEKPLPLKDQSKTIDQALEHLKQKVQKEKSLEKTLTHLEDKVKGEQALEKAMAQLERKKPGPGTAVPGTGTGTGGPGDITSSTPGGQDGVGIQFQLYQASLVSRIKKNWGLPDGLRKGKDLSADIMVRISRSGRIEDFRFERKSGIEVFDQEVLRTLKKSSPLPPLPEGYPKSSYEFFLTFHSKDLSGN